MRESFVPAVAGYVPGWGVVCGMLGVYEERFREREFFLALVAQERQGEIFSRLQDTVVRDVLTPGAAWEDFTAMAHRCFHAAAISLRPLCPAPVPVDVFMAPFDFLNLKAAFAGRDEARFPPCLFDREHLAAFARGERDDLPASVRSASQWQGWDVAKSVDGDLLIDGAYCRHILSMAEDADSGLIAMWAREHIRASLVKLFWRASIMGFPARRIRQNLEPMGDLEGLLEDLAGQANPQSWPTLVGGEVGDLVARALDERSDDAVTVFSDLADRHLVDVASPGRYQTAGPERVFAFMADFQFQVATLTLAVAGRLGGLRQDILKRRIELRYA